MKPLELTVYPRHPQFGHYAVPLRVWSRIPDDDPDDFYEVTVSPDDLQQRIESKRFTDAELAAEYYAQDSKCRHEQWIETVRGDDDYTKAERVGQSRMYEQLTALHRFATMAHYDQEEAQA